MALRFYIPSPPINGFHVGPAYIHFYGLMYVIGIALAILITQRRWKVVGGDPALVGDVALWAVPAGIVGGRIYFDLTTRSTSRTTGTGSSPSGTAGWASGAGSRWPRSWGLAGAPVRGQRDAVHERRGPGAAGGPGHRPGGQLLQPGAFRRPQHAALGPAHRLCLPPPGYKQYQTFHPTFLYEFIFDLLWAAVLVWLGHHRNIKPPGLFALYVAGYSGFRIFEESLRVDPSEHFLGLRLNMYVASVLTVVGVVWFIYSQRHGQAGELQARRVESDDAGRDGQNTGQAESTQTARATDTA